MLRTLKKKIVRLRQISIVNTIYLNFKVFPFSEAYKLPIWVGHRVQFDGLKKGCILIPPPRDRKSGCVRLGISYGKTYADKMLYSLISIKDSGKLIFSGKGETRIYGGCSLICRNNGVLQIGANLIMNQCSFICCHNRITIGDFCNIGWNCQIYDTDFHLIYNARQHYIKNPMDEVHIMNNVWLCHHVVVSKKSYIPAYSIVGANSYFNKDFSKISTKGNLFVGSPAQIKIDGGIYRLRNGGFEKRIVRHFLETGEKQMMFDRDFPYEEYLKIHNAYVSR